MTRIAGIFPAVLKEGEAMTGGEAAINNTQHRGEVFSVTELSAV